MDVGWVSALVALAGAAVAAASVVVTVLEGRRMRRNTEFSVHRTCGGSVGRGSSSARCPATRTTTMLPRS